ncbi:MULTISPECIES: LamG domain-containing protein [Streptomyces]|uniref:LamG-like jellyroll fold domain-containing protein n=2 Tax=Streptomyces TaxID=1883 RepID=A0A100Y0F4_9ACTN|nr:MULTISPECIES: LamG domain-containing protein [Streptomyces]KUH35414.1 hypothetical protein ATE80_29315 [Streptomyces kanasensis]UUS31075.1 LamG domain-containing protein [Streptomyces changanensis]
MLVPSSRPQVGRRAGRPSGRFRFTAALAFGLLAAAAVPPAYATTATDDPVPRAPRVTSLGPYEECTTNQCATHGASGLPGRFRFTPDPADEDVTSYRVRVGGEVHTISAAEAESFAFVPPTAGFYVLYVEAADRGSRYGPETTFSFKVGYVEEAARWRFDDGLTDPSATVAADSGVRGAHHDAALHTDGDPWSPLARAGDRDRALLLDAPGEGRPQEYAQTARPVVDTSRPFTVSAWAQLADTGADRVVLSAPGEHGSAFELLYSAADRRWAFGRTARDEPGAPRVRSLATTADPARNAWTHLAGVFHTRHDTDPSNDTVQLYVNGRPQGSPVVLAEGAPAYEPWTSTAGLQFGRGRTGGAYDGHFLGRIDEVRAWQWALTADDVRNETDVRDAEGYPAVPLAAHWDAASAGDGRVPQVGPYPVGDMTLSPAGATLDAGEGSVLLDGVAGHLSATGPVVDETGSFTVSARVRVDSAGLESKPVGYRALVAGQRAGSEYSWALWARKTSPETWRWEFSRTVLGPDGESTDTATVGSNEVVAADTWVDLTGSYDALDGNGRLTLYVDASWQYGSGASELNGVQQGGGVLGAGGDARDGATTEHALPGALKSLRVWTGAMTPDGLWRHVLPQ